MKVAVSQLQWSKLFFNRLLDSIVCFENKTQNNCQLLICGEFNSRTSTNPDFVEKDESVHMSVLPDDYIPECAVKMPGGWGEGVRMSYAYMSSSEHTTLNRCCFNVSRQDVESTLFQRCVPDGRRKKTSEATW